MTIITTPTSSIIIIIIIINDSNSKKKRPPLSSPEKKKVQKNPWHNKNIFEVKLCEALLLSRLVPCHESLASAHTSARGAQGNLWPRKRLENNKVGIYTKGWGFHWGGQKMTPKDVSGFFGWKKCVLSQSEVLKTNLGLSFINAFEEGLQEVPFLGMF